MRFARASAGTFATQVVGVGVRVLWGALVARVLEPENKGVQTIATTTAMMLVAAGNLGLAQAIVYFTASRRGEPRRLVGIGAVSAVALGMVLAVVCWLLRPWLLSFGAFRGVTPAVLAVAVTIPGAMLLQAHMQGVVRGLARISWYNLNDLLVRFSSLAAVVVLMVVWRGGIRGALASQTFGYLVPALVTAWLLRREFGVLWRPGGALLRQLLGYGIRAHPQTAADFLNAQRLDMFVLAHFYAHDTKQVGYFSVAVAAAGLLWFTSDAVGTVLLPVASAGTEEQANRFSPQVCRHTIFLTTLAGAAMMLLVRPATWLVYGEAYMPAVNAILVLVPGFVVYSITKVLVRDLAGRGLPLIPSLATVANVLVSLGLDFVLIPRFGILGAALAYTVACVVGTAIVLPVFLLRAGVSLSDTLLIRRSDFGVYRRAWRTILGGEGAAPEPPGPGPLDGTTSGLQ